MDKKHMKHAKESFRIEELPELKDDDELLDSHLVDPPNTTSQDPQSFSQLFEKSQASTKYKEGEVVEGQIVGIEGDYVIVDIGYKSEGRIHLLEFSSASGKASVEIGDPVLVYIVQIEDDNGQLILSKEKADVLRAWNEISEACENNELVEGVVTAKVKGGLSVDIGVKAFLPGSQIDVRPIKNLDQFLGKTYKFKIIKFNKKRGNIVLSRRMLLLEERARMKEQTLSKIEEGMLLEGSIKNVTDYGAFIDLGGLDGLLHITDMSWGRIKHPSELFKVGNKIQVKVLKYDEEKERVSLGYKQLFPDPWSNIEGRFKIGDRVKGHVVSLTDYGAFIEIEPGIEGLVHVSEMSWTQRVKQPSKIVNEGDVVEAVILEIDMNNRRISLGMKQIEPNPWDIISEKYPIGSKITGTVKNTTDFGVFIGVPEGVDGLVHVTDISWTDQAINPSTIYKKGDTVECIVLGIDKAGEKFSLGIKQLSQDPWIRISEKYPYGTKLKGMIRKVTDQEAFIDIEGEESDSTVVSSTESSQAGQEGENKKPETKRIFECVLPANEVKGEGKPKERLRALFELGQPIEAKVIEQDPKEKRIIVSIKALLKAEERENLKHYAKIASSSSKTSLGDFLDEETQKKLKEAPLRDEKTKEEQIKNASTPVKKNTDGDTNNE